MLIFIYLFIYLFIFLFIYLFIFFNMFNFAFLNKIIRIAVYVCFAFCSFFWDPYPMPVLEIKMPALHFERT